MRRTKMMLLALAVIMTAQTAMTSSAQAQVLTGDARLACEALLCLGASGSAPGECSKALAKYEAMKAQLWFNPMAVYNFLKGCPKK
ncbi:MAG: TrbM/KikA/MpfK family conjugal transfer protein [Nitrospirota bacterium]